MAYNKNYDNSYDKNFEKYTPDDEEKPYPCRKEPSRLHFRRPECGKVAISCENVYITINCGKEKRWDD